MKVDKTKKFIEEANKIHDNKYDYSLVKKLNSSRERIKIICKVHGIFERNTRYHLEFKLGCPKCKELDSKELKKQEFLKQANKVHNNKYDYFLIRKNENLIICPIHGRFKQDLNLHLDGKECPKCEKQKKLEVARQKFIDDANKLYSNKFDYTLVIYKNKISKIRIICPKHTVFETDVYNHLKGKDCSKCKKEKYEDLEKQKILKEVKKIHNNKYDYSLVEYKRKDKKIKVLCQKHGVFHIKPYDHLNGYGCYKCRNEEGKSIRFNRILKEAKLRHNNKYDYCLVEQKNNVKVICPEHGEFEVNLYYHAKGRKCPKCIEVEKLKNIIRITKSRAKRLLVLASDEFKLVAKKKFGSKYDYSLVIYKHKKQKVKITCPKHGLFEQMPSSHLKSGCLECQIEEQRANRLERFIKKANEVHNNKYDYSLISSVTGKNQYEISIICPEHGEFIQNPKYHLMGSGCSQCVLNRKIQEYLELSKIVHDNKFDYSKVDSKDFPYAEIVCTKHGSFKQALHYHSIGRSCPKCFKYSSKFEGEILEFIGDNYEGESISRDRKAIKFELDIYLPELKLAFEYNGFFWHCEINKDNDYHLKKTELCESKGIHLIHIYEDDWKYKRDVVKSRILSLLGRCERVYARKCDIRLVDTKEKTIFLNKNHLQGDVKSKINLGLYYDDELVSIMTFGKLRKSLGTKSIENNYELLRFCNKLKMTVIGGASRLFKYFNVQNNPELVVSYADRSWTSSIKDNLYNDLNFNFKKKTVPNYFYIDDGIRKHRFGFRKDVLVRQGFDKNKTERKIMQERNIYRIYNSGNLKYEFQK